uniref:Uncharacterized protein n=1 Tax=Knipowitschia caucasica TaxID=637954 RepID=A0AAV2JYN2_KNICA
MDHFSEISVSTEASLQIVRSHFEQIGGLQWVMLSKGMCDLETRRILTAMFNSLVQTLSANILGLIVPRSEVNHKFLSESESTRAHGSVVNVVQNTMGQVFSQALNLPTDSLDKHQDSQELTTLIKQEVSTKVNRVLSEEQEEGPRMVDSFISSESVARSMIEKGNSCLKGCLRTLFCSCGLRAATKKSDSLENGPCRCSFLRFAKNNFRSMQENLEAELLVEELEPETRSLSRGSSCGSYSDLEKTLGYALRTPEVSFEQLQPEVEELFRKLDLSTSPDKETNQERLPQALDSESITAFAQKLTDTMYCHFQILNKLACAASPNAETRREFENQYPEQTYTRKTRAKCKPRHHDLKRTYTTVRNEVSDHLQTLQNYITQDPLENFYRQDLFELCMEKPPLSPNSQKALTYNVSVPSQGSVPVQMDFQQLPGQSFNSQKHDLFERSMVHPRACVPSRISRDVPAIVLRTPEVSTRTISGISENSLRSHKDDLFEKSLLPPKVEVPSFIHEYGPACLMKIPESMTRISDRDMTLCLIEALMIEMFRGKAALRPWDKNYKVIRDRLTEKAWEEIQLSEHQVKKTEKGMSKIIVAIVKDLKSQYGTAQRMLENALDGKDRTFDETVLKSLQYHLEHNLRKKSFLSRVSRGLWKLAQCCCCPNIEELTPSEHPNASYKTRLVATKGFG